MSIKVEITADVSDVQKLLRALDHAEKKVIPQEVKRSVKRMEQFSKKLIRTGSRSGIHYSGQPNKSSAPGEAPKSQTGFLASSIKSQFKHSIKAGITEGVVGSSAPHALWLEVGTETSVGSTIVHEGGIAPRPFFRPTIEREIPILVENIVDALF